VQQTIIEKTTPCPLMTPHARGASGRKAKDGAKDDPICMYVPKTPGDG
jgi:hypothetical protein